MKSLFLARVHEQEVTHATHAFKECHNTLADRHRLWAARLSLMKEDKVDFFFRMTYFHQLYQRVNGDIQALEMLINSNNGAPSA